MKASELLDHEGNWRTHPEAQKAGMVGVLDEVGIVDALTVYESKTRGGLVIIDGHLRKSIDPDQEWPVDVLDVDDAEADYILATKDPLAAAAAANREKLGTLLHSVQSGEAGVQALLSELAEREGVVLGNGKEPPEDPGPQVDKAAELQEKWQVQTGDLWVIPSKTADGEHRVICGDCTDRAVVERVMGGEKAGAIVTDPPYGMRLETMRRHGDSVDFVRAKRNYAPIIGDAEQFDRRYFVIEAEEEFWFGADYYVDTLPNCGKNGSWLVWNKRAEGGNERMQGSMFELIWSKKKHRREILHIVWNGVLGHIKQLDGEEKYHPALKPAKLIMEIVERWCGDVILDPFFGSGTTMVAAERLGRLCRGIEIDAKYVSVTLERLQGLGLDPRRLD